MRGKKPAVRAQLRRSRRSIKHGQTSTIFGVHVDLRSAYGVWRIARRVCSRPWPCRRLPVSHVRTDPRTCGSSKASRVNFGVSASGIDPSRIADFAVRAEQLGYESVWMPEHIIMPTVIKSAPPHAGGRPGTTIDMSGAGFLPMLDPFMTLCSLASVTSRVRLGTSVTLIALRDPFLAARCIVTLDLLSAGRATVGVGAGWCDEEYQLMGVDFAGRGRRLEEMLEIFTELFTAPFPEFHGRGL
jgi:alkanesulfonate monooxygenase SsuD/methylene tetrahydromethanopterin reductase-like flavin-dependent oxidoreductase (luciferase family)